MDCVLVIDVSCLAHRSYHVMGELKFREQPTGALFGVLRDVAELHHRYEPEAVAWCFDSPRSDRRAVYPGYKRSRAAKMTPVQVTDRQALNVQLNRLRTELLPALGYSNIYQQQGYEGDDMIASVVTNTQAPCIIVGADKDLFQLLVRDRVMMYNPHTHGLITADAFTAEHGVEPWQWWRVLAIAGDPLDDVPGVPGVGPYRAAQYMRGQLGKKSKAYAAIEAHSGLIRTNRQLVRLPFDGASTAALQPDNLSDDKWDAVCTRLGMDTLARGRGW